MHNQRVTNIQGTNQLEQLANYNGPIQVMGSNNKITLVQCNGHLNIMGTGNIITIDKCQFQIKIYGSQNMINIERSDLAVSCYGSANQIKIYDKQNISRVNVMENNGYDNIVIACPRKIVPNNLHIKQEEQKKQPINPVRSIRSVSNPEIQRRKVAQRYWRQRLQHNQAIFRAQRNVRQIQQRQEQHEQIEKQQKIQGLTQQQIDKFPIDQKQKNDNKNCSICLERIAKGEYQMFLLCFHSFHSQCCTDWLQKSSTCPICNLNMKLQLRKA